MAYDLLLGRTNTNDWSLGASMMTLPSPKQRHTWSKHIADQEAAKRAGLPPPSPPDDEKPSLGFLPVLALVASGAIVGGLIVRRKKK